MNVYRFLADLLVVLHFAYVGFVVVGMLAILLGMALRWRWIGNFYFRLIHLMMIGVVVVQALAGTACPLTKWEDDLREKGGDVGQPGTFIGRWVHRVLFFGGPEWVFTVCYCVFGAAVLATFVLSPPRWPRWLLAKR